jgi:hypothetical protein
VVSTAVPGIIGAASRFGEEFLPEFREGHFVLQASVSGNALPMMRLGLISDDL